MRAADALRARLGGPVPPFRLILDKALPIAAGLGGGSSDAGAALRLLREALAPDLSTPTWKPWPAASEADGAACLWGAPVMAQGRGERLAPAAGLAGAATPCWSTRWSRRRRGAVYRAYDAAVPSRGRGRAADAGRAGQRRGGLRLAGRLHPQRPAGAGRGPGAAHRPGAGAAGRRARDPAGPDVRLGATCFALCAGDIEAESLAERIEQMRPDWWVKRCRLGGPF